MLEHTFFLKHRYIDDRGDQSKNLGVFSSRIEAEKAITILKKVDGFKDWIDGFYIYEVELDEIDWEKVKIGDAAVWMHDSNINND